MTSEHSRRSGAFVKARIWLRCRSSGFKELVREQFFMLLIDPNPPRLPLSPRCWRPSRAQAPAAFELIKQVTGASGALPPEGEQRLRQIESLFCGADESTLAPTIDTKAKTSPAKPARSRVVQNEGSKK